MSSFFNQKKEVPKILINNSDLFEQTKNENLKTPDFHKNLLQKKTSSLHTKRFSVNYVPLNQIKKEKLENNKPRKSSLDPVKNQKELIEHNKSILNSNFDKSDEKQTEVKGTHIKTNNKLFVRKETVRKKAINTKDVLLNTEEKLLFIEYFFEAKQTNIAIERRKISNNWLSNQNILDYDQFLSNALYASQLKFEEFKAKKLQNKEKEASLSQEIQNLMNKRKWPLFNSNKTTNQDKENKMNKFHSLTSKGILLQKTGSKFSINCFRRVFFSDSKSITLPEYEKRFSFLQVKTQDKIKEYPLPEIIILEKKTETSQKLLNYIKHNFDWKTSKLKKYEFRVLISHSSRKNPIALYLENFEEAKEVYNYLIFKKFLKNFPFYRKFFQRLSLNYCANFSSFFAECLFKFFEKKERFLLDPKSVNFDGTSEEVTSSSSEEEMKMSRTSREKNRGRDISLNRKTQQLFLVIKCLQDDLMKSLMETWLKAALQKQRELFNQHKSLYGLDPKDIMFFETKKKRLAAIEALKKDEKIIGFERSVMRKFIANWLEKIIKKYKDKITRKNTFSAHSNLFLKFLKLEIPIEFEYFKPKLQIKFIRKDIEKNGYMFINGKRVLIDKEEFYTLIFETELKEKKMPGLLTYEVIEGIIEIKEFQTAKDYISIEMFDDSCLSIFENYKDPLAFNFEQTEKSKDQFDIGLFFASSRLITHRIRVFLKNILHEQKTDYWMCFDINQSLKDKIQRNSAYPSAVFANFCCNLSQENSNKIASTHDSVFNANLQNLIENFDPKIMKHLKIFSLLSGILSETKILFLKTIDDPEILLKELPLLIIKRINESICKNYMKMMKFSSEWFIAELKDIFEENCLKTRSFFLHLFREAINIKYKSSFDFLIYSGVCLPLRRILWGLFYREKILEESLNKYLNFRTEHNIVKALPSPMTEENIYKLFLDENLLMNYDKLNYLCFLQDLNHEVRFNCSQNLELISFLKDNDHYNSVLNILKAIFFWSFVTNNRIAISFSMISLVSRIMQIFEGNYPYYPSENFDSSFHNKLNSFSTMESDVFWVAIVTINYYFPKVFLLEAPKNPLQSSNHYCYSDLRGFKGDLTLLTLYLKENYSEISEFFASGILEIAFLSDLLDLLTKIFNRRVDLWGKIFDLVLMQEIFDDSENELVILSVICAVLCRIYNSSKAKLIKNFQHLKILIILEIELCDDADLLITNIIQEKKKLQACKQKNKQNLEAIEWEILESLSYYNKYNQNLYNLIEQGKDFYRIQPDSKLSLCDLYRILSIENLLKETENAENFLYIYIHNLTLFYSDNFEEELLLEINFQGNQREIPLKIIIDTRIELNEYICFKYNHHPHISNNDNLTISIYQISHKTQKTLLKACEILLTYLSCGVLYKNCYKLISPCAALNYLTAEINISLLLGSNACETSFAERVIDPEQIFLYEPNRFPYLSKYLFPEFLFKFRHLIDKINENYLLKQIKNSEDLLENPVGKSSSSCKNDYFYWRTRCSLGNSEMYEIINKLLPLKTKDSESKIMNFLECIKSNKKKDLKFDLSDLLIGLTVMLSGTFETKYEIFYKIMVLLNKGEAIIPINLLKGVIMKIYKFLGVFILDSALENILDGIIFNEFLQNKAFKKAEIKHQDKVFCIKNILNDFLIKKQEIFHSRDIILGSSTDLFGLRDIINFYLENDHSIREYNDLKSLLAESQKTKDLMQIKLKYKDNQGLSHVFHAKFDHDWKLNFEYLSNKSGSILYTQKKKENNSILNEKFFYEHRNVLILSTPSTKSLDIAIIFEIFSKLPGFNYALSLQNQHKIFNKLKENPLNAYPEQQLILHMNLEFGMSFEISLKFDERGSFINKRHKLQKMKSKKSCLSFDNLYFNNKTMQIEKFQLTVHKADFFSPFHYNFLKIITKIVKKIKEAGLENDFDLLDSVPTVNLLENKINNPLDIENLSLFSVFFLNKNLNKFTLEISFLKKTLKNNYLLIKSDKKIKALGLYYHSDQSKEWMRVKLLHSFLSKERIKAKIPLNFQWDNKKNYDYFTVCFEKFPCEIFIKKPYEVILLKEHDFRNMQIPIEINDFLPKLKAHPDQFSSKLLHKKDEKINESIFNDALKENLIVSRKLTIDDRKKRERKPGKRVLSYLAKNI